MDFRKPPTWAILAILLFAATLPASAQLTADQKVQDFMSIVDQYANGYAPYEWKKLTQRFDLYDTRPWIERIRGTQNDIEYMELLVDWLGSFNDAHISYSWQVLYQGQLGFTVDIYDGKLLIDSINRNLLPATRFPFQTGDQLISVDDRTAEEWVRFFSRYTKSANDRSTARSAAGRITSRNQATMPSMPSFTPATSRVVIKRRGAGEETYDMSWNLIGTPFTSFGKQLLPSTRNAEDTGTGSPMYWDDSIPEYFQGMMPYLQASVDRSRHAVLSMGSRTPIFQLPAGFRQRLGTQSADFFYSGTFTADGLTIGYIRIPSFSPPSSSLAVQQFQQEMVYFNANTDGLIIDDMRNPGGSVGFAESLLQLVHPDIFRTLGFELRATSDWLYSYNVQVHNARVTGQPDWVQSSLASNLNAIRIANSEVRGRTGAISLNSTGSLELLPSPDAYRKPVMVLVDEFSASGGDMFPAVLQDNRRALVYGMRTMGAGGNVIGIQSGGLSLTYFRVIQSLMNRKSDIVTTEYPAAPYVENIGVRPDVVADYMTEENLLNGGRPFVNGFVSRMVEYIRAGGR